MKAIMAPGLFVFIAAALLPAAEKSDLDEVKAELKSLRVQAYKEPAVKAAREKLDAAYREYWNVVRKAMIRLEPSKKSLIEQDVDSRKAKSAIMGESKKPAAE